MLVQKEMQRDNLSYYECSSPSRPVSIVSIPTELGSDARGCRETPTYLYKHGLETMLAAIGTDISEQVAIPCPKAPTASFGLLKNLHEVAAVASATTTMVAAAARRGDIILALGGDHSMALGTIAGAGTAYDSLGVIYVDAHPDTNTPETTASGNIHGMVAAAAMGMGHPQLINPNPITPENFLHIGLKDMDQTEIEFLRREKLHAITMLDIAGHGLSPAFAAINALAKRAERVWVSFDIDSIDQAYAPGVAMPSTDGFTRREALSLAHYIGQTVTLAGIDIVEMLPANDKDDMTAQLAVEIVARLLGGEVSSYRSYMDNYEKINNVGERKEARG